MGRGFIPNLVNILLRLNINLILSDYATRKVCRKTQNLECGSRHNDIAAKTVRQQEEFLPTWITSLWQSYSVASVPSSWSEEWGIPFSDWSRPGFCSRLDVARSVVKVWALATPRARPGQLMWTSQYSTGRICSMHMRWCQCHLSLPKVYLKLKTSQY